MGGWEQPWWLRWAWTAWSGWAAQPGRWVRPALAAASAVLLLAAGAVAVDRSGDGRAPAAAGRGRPADRGAARDGPGGGRPTEVLGGSLVAPAAPGTAGVAVGAEALAPGSDGPAPAAGARRSGRSARAATVDERPAACQPVTGRVDGVDLWQVGCGRPTVFYLHAHGERVGAWYRPDLLAALADTGFGVVAGDLGGDTWGNDIAIAALEHLVATYGDGGPSRFLVMSMGGATLLNYAHRHPGMVKAAVGLIPVTTWTLLLALAAGPQPPLPTQVAFPYTIWEGQADLITGPAAVPAQVHRFAGGHDGHYPFPVEEIARLLR